MANSTLKAGGLIYNNATTLKATAITVANDYASTSLESDDYPSSVVTIDAASRSKAINITGNAKNNKILGGKGADTLAGGDGNDTLTGGNGNDIFIYSAGKDVITDYTAAQDTLKIASGSISSYSFSGNNATFKIGSGSVQITGGKNSAIAVVDSNNDLKTYDSGLIYDGTVAKAKTLTISAAHSNTLTSYGASVVTIDASARTAATHITGNALSNFISGGAKNDVIDGDKGNDSIDGGKGADVLTGGAGKDVFIYSNGDGNDVITDYTAGEDKIKILSGKVSGYSVKNDDAILKVGSGNITLKNAADSKISVLDANDNLLVFDGGLIYNNSKISRATSATITADYDAEEFGSYGASVETIDAADRSKAIEIIGNTGDNFILGGKGKDTIDGGKGDDTIFAGKGNDVFSGGKGSDVFYFGSADGNDTITDYSAGDIISVDSAISSYTRKNGNAILKIGSGNVTLNDAADTAITIVGANSMASIYSGSSKVQTKNWTGTSESSVAETVTVTATETVTVNVTLPAVTLPAETVNVTLPAETETVQVTVTVGGGGGSVISGTSGNNTLVGTSGNDTFTGGNGNDIFVYGGGSDIITDYGTGSDSISIGANSLGGGALIGNDVIFAVGSGMLKLTGAKDKNVTIISSDGARKYVNGVIPSSATVPTDDGVTVTLQSGFGGNFSLPSYNASAQVAAQNIDGSEVRNTYQFYGDDNANIIRAGIANGHLIGRGGDDTIYGGTGNDSIWFYEYDGNDTVYNFRNNDRICLGTNGKVQFENFSVDGSDVIINLTQGGSITLKDAKKQQIDIYDRESTSSSYGTYTGTFGNILFSGDSATLETGYTNIFRPEWYSENPQNIDATEVINTLQIYGDKRANVIRAGRVGGYILPGEGNDTLYCGDGNDSIWYYEYEGSDTIYNYRSGDGIYLATNGKAQFDYFALDGDDVLIHLTQGSTLTLKDAKEQQIYVFDRESGSGATYSYGTYNGTFGDVSISGNSVTLKSGYAGTFNTSWYLLNPKDINATEVVNSIRIYGDSRANVIRVGKAGGHVIGGEGNDSIYLGNGNDSLWYYEYDGNDTVYNYRTGDGIYLGTNGTAQFENFALSGKDVIVNLTQGGSITLKDAKEQRIYVLDRSSVSGNTNYSYETYSGTFGDVSISGNTVSLNAGYAGTFNTSWYLANPKDINATEVKNSITIYGDAQANVIRAGKAGGNIIGGEGNDSIYGGVGSDTLWFYEYCGNDTVINYRSDDLIYLGTTGTVQFKNFDVSGDDVIINLTKGDSITLNNAKTQMIHVYDRYSTGSSSNNKTYSSTFGDVSISGGTAKLGAGFEGTFDSSWYADKPKDIDASTVKNSIAIYGDDRANVITAGKAGGSIDAGEGADTIYFGVGNDTLSYTRGDGNDTIYSVGDSDVFILSSCTSDNVSVKGNDVIITTTSDEKLTLKDAAGKYIGITGQGWKIYTAAVAGSSSNLASDLFDDDNFISGSDLDSIIDSGGGLTDLKFSATNFENLAQDETFIAYSEK